MKFLSKKHVINIFALTTFTISMSFLGHTESDAFLDKIQTLQSEVQAQTKSYEDGITEIKKIIWDKKEIFTRIETEENKAVFNAIHDLLPQEFMTFAMPHQSSFSKTPELYKNDPYIYVTSVYALQKMPMPLGDDLSFYDHVGLIFEYYDEESQTLKAYLSHLTTSDDWNKARVFFQAGYTNIDYGIRKLPFDSIVAYTIYQYKRQHDRVRYYPHTTYRILRTHKIPTFKNSEQQTVFDLVKHLNEIGAEVRHDGEKIFNKGYPYSLYGRRVKHIPNQPTLEDVFSGRDNCISFIAKVMWCLGIFKDHSLPTLFNYSNVDPVGEAGLYKYLHHITKRIVYSPEWLKHITRDSAMATPGHILFIPSTTEQRPLRDNHNIPVDERIKQNIAHGFLNLSQEKLKKYQDKITQEKASKNKHTVIQTSETSSSSTEAEGDNLI